MLAELLLSAITPAGRVARQMGLVARKPAAQALGAAP
jgi:hypothetical protein